MPFKVSHCFHEYLFPSFLLSSSFWLESKSQPSHHLSRHSSQSKGNFGIPDALILDSQTLTLESFLKVLSSRDIGPIPDDASLFQKFENNRIEIQNRSEKFSEADLQAQYFEEWKKYGDNVLENTKGIISGEAGEFRKLNFANQRETIKFPDLTLRLPTNEDPGPEYGEAALRLPANKDPGPESGAAALPLPANKGAVWRLCPWTVIAYLDLKATSDYCIMPNLLSCVVLKEIIVSLPFTTLTL